MLHLSSPLLFPSLVYQKDFTIKYYPPFKGENGGETPRTGKPSWTKKVRLYKLDWKKVELRKEEHHKKWNKEYWPDIEVPYVNTLPEELDEEVESYVFALDRGYSDEIRRCSQQGVQEWNISRPFDTIIREMCLDVPQSYVKVAFSLLSDCIFDEGRGYWDRGNRRDSACIMLYKFWCHQSGRGLLFDRSHSGWQSEYDWQKKWTEKGSEAMERVEKINSLLKDNSKKMDESMSKIYIEAKNNGDVDI